MRYIFLSIFLFGGYLGEAQTSLDDYKYIVVPKKLSSFKRDNQYQTSTLIKHLFSKKGFTTVWEDALPDDVMNNRCSALFAELRDKSSMFSTKAAIVLSDCSSKEVFVTKEGKSKAKDFKESYGEAIRAAMTSFDGLNYSYNGKAEATGPITVSFKNDVKNLDDGDKSVTKMEKMKQGVIVEEATTKNQTYKDHTPRKSDLKKTENEKKIIEQKATREEQSYKSLEPISTDIKKTDTTNDASVSGSIKKIGEVLYAQEIENGYQLVDNSPKIRLKIRKTSLPDHYLAEGTDKNGMVYIKDGKWYFEYYHSDRLTLEELNIKF